MVDVEPGEQRSISLQPSCPPFRTCIRALDMVGDQVDPRVLGRWRGCWYGEGRAVGVEDSEQLRDLAIHHLPAGCELVPTLLLSEPLKEDMSLTLDFGHKMKMPRK